MAGRGARVKVPPPRKSLGQHFLSDPEVLRRIVEASGVQPGEAVLEIGPGPGGLTRALSDASAEARALEADERRVEYLAGLRLPGVRVEHADALEVDYRELARAAGGPFRLVANLPYNISGPLIAKLLRERAAFRSMTVMLQKEVAERLLAPPGTKARGRLSVMTQAFCRIRPVLRVSAGAFRPRPKVDSEVVHLDVLERPVALLDDEATLWRTTAFGFGQRRKMLRNSLKAAGPTAEDALAAAELSGTERAEELTAEAWIRLANAFFTLALREEEPP
ncbi:MAG: ribosomal RNA small subunit methyltransferase A [Deltaproteobacteria bacterium]|nr:ribosomal RNA small subunit methyltransferase A [Deltaproteobacteria bacterium]